MNETRNEFVGAVAAIARRAGHEVAAEVQRLKL